MNKSGIILLISAISIALLFTWFNTSWLSFKGLHIKQNIKKIDYYLSDFTLFATQPDGQMRFKVEAQHLIHQQSTGKSEIYKPRIEAQDTVTGLITLKAQKAVQQEKDSEITLMGDVTIDNESNEKTKGFHIATENLTYNPITRSISTDAEITLNSTAGLLKGIGLSSNLDQQELRILSNVHAEFNPAP